MDIVGHTKSNGKQRWHLRLPAEFITSGAWAALTNRARNVLIVLAVHADGSGRCWPTIATIASLSGLNRATVHRAIDDLVAAGHLERETRGGGRGDQGHYASTVYRLSVAQLRPLSGDSSRTTATANGLGVAHVQLSSRSGATEQSHTCDTEQRQEQRHQHHHQRARPRASEAGSADGTGEAADDDDAAIPPMERAASADAATRRILNERLGVKHATAATIAGVTPDDVIRVWLDLGGHARNPVGLLVAKLRDRDPPTQQPSVERVLKAIKQGVIRGVELDGVEYDVANATKVGHNSDGLYVDGSLVIPTDRMDEVAFG